MTRSKFQNLKYPAAFPPNSRVSESEICVSARSRFPAVSDSETAMWLSPGAVGQMAPALPLCWDAMRVSESETPVRPCRTTPLSCSNRPGRWQKFQNLKLLGHSLTLCVLYV